ncbi:hypothetical protein DL769_002384 [Monosporascus sp. CRB-8-3]|nr:hypothetical protein DL769_002384 [Monosporascus sp. CRB-8-3]
MPTNRADVRPTENLGRGCGGRALERRRRPSQLTAAGTGTRMASASTSTATTSFWTRTVLPGGTNSVDSNAGLGEPNTNRVRPVVDGEGAGGEWRVRAAGRQPRISISSGDPINFVWVDNLDGDGEYIHAYPCVTGPPNLASFLAHR